MTTILIVDDSGMDRRLAGGLLMKRADWSVVYAINGRDALTQIELHLPDVVLTDLQMPEMSGLELVQHMKSSYPLLPVVLMTAQGSEEIAVQALHAGAASYVPKKDLSRDLVETVEHVLVASSKQRSSSRLLFRMVKTEMSFILENELSLLPSLINHLQQTAISMRVCDEADSLRVGVALEEALLNAYYHGNLDISSKLREKDHNAYYHLARERSQQEPYRDRRIYVDARFTSTEAEFAIRDDGSGFDPGSLPDATDPANLERPCGRGVLLMRTFMDGVSFSGRGNEVRMLKRRKPRASNGDPGSNGSGEEH